MKEITETQFRAALNRVAATEDGKILLAVMKESCGWDKTYLASDNPQTTHYYAARRGVYGSLRQHINPDYLKEIEFDYKQKVEKNGTTRKHSITGRKSSAATIGTGGTGSK